MVQWTELDQFELWSERGIQKLSLLKWNNAASSRCHHNLIICLFALDTLWNWYQRENKQNSSYWSVIMIGEREKNNHQFQSNDEIERKLNILSSKGYCNLISHFKKYRQYCLSIFMTHSTTEEDTAFITSNYDDFHFSCMKYETLFAFPHPFIASS